MKIFDAAQTRLADESTIAAQGITSLQLMERASHEAFLWIKNSFPDKETVFHIFCGQGNNGGDGLHIALMLHQDGYPVVLNVIESAGQPTADFSAALQKVNHAGISINTGAAISSFGKGKPVIIDAIFGIGLSRELHPDCADIIDSINTSKAFVVSIDVPSGLFMEKTTTHAVKADVVLTFQYPKLPLYLHRNYRFIKKIVTLDIGLDKNFLNNTPSNIHYIDKAEAVSRYRPVEAYAHKGTQGHALIIGGSYGKVGAVALAAKAALKAGSGLVTAYVPECGYVPLQTALPEAMVITDGEKYLTEISFDIEPRAIGIGMGVGQHPDAQQALHIFLMLEHPPLVIDADALNILSYHKEWLELVPENSILTPHPRELQRLIGEWSDDFEKLEVMKDFSKQHQLVLVAKDARTMVVYHDDVYINSTGNAALATGGSGDVLCGIITGLLAQGYNPVDAAIFGVYLHGLTADIAVVETGAQAFTASDITGYIGRAYLEIEKSRI